MLPEKIIAAALERFQNSCAPLRSVRGGIFLRKMPLSNRGSWVQQFWNRCNSRGECLEMDNVRVDGQPPTIHLNSN